MWKNGARLDLGAVTACSAQNPTDVRQGATATSRRMPGPVDSGLAGSDNFARLTQTVTQTSPVFVGIRSQSLTRENHCLAGYSGCQRKSAKPLDISGVQVVAGSNAVSPTTVMSQDIGIVPNLH